MKFTNGDSVLSALLCPLNEAFSFDLLPPSMTEATIVVIPKSDKDPLHPESYRPISLLSKNFNI